jgi:NADPH2:quinone reductase
MSRVVRFHRLGGPEVLQIEEIPDRALKEGELRVRIKAIGLNRAEQMYRAGVYLQTPVLPSLNGCEASAIVMELGPGVSGFSVGEPISIIPNFSLNDYGVYAEVAVVPAYAVVKRPKGLTAVEAAAVWMAYVTAYGALIDIAKIGKGDAIVITAATSVGGQGVDKLAQATSPGGTLFLYGGLSLEPTIFPVASALMKGLSLRGYVLFEILGDKARREAAIAFITKGLEVGALKPVIAKTFQFDSIVEAHRYLESNAQFGKIVVTVG